MQTMLLSMTMTVALALAGTAAAEGADYLPSCVEVHYEPGGEPEIKPDPDCVSCPPPSMLVGGQNSAPDYVRDCLSL